MRFSIAKTLTLPVLALPFLLLSCDQDLVSSADQPAVDYILLIADSATAAPLGDVEVRVTTRNGDTATYRSDAAEGRVEAATVASSQTLFRLSKAGYRTRDLVDSVDAKPDTVFNRAIQRVLRIRMLDLDGDSGRVQVKILLRNEDLEWLRKGQAEYMDSLGIKQVVTDHDSDGTLALHGLAKGNTPVTVKHPSYLGLLAEVKVVADTGKAEMTTVILKDLKNSISGQVYIKTATSSKALPDAKVEFHLKDSSAVPRYFRGYTGADLAQDGRFVLPNVPALDGEIRYYKDRSSAEPAKVVPISKEEVMQDGSLPRVILAPLADSLSPLLVSGPGKTLPGNDTVGTGDTLQFKFNQRVEEERSLQVRLINGAELLIGSRWSDSMTLLKVWQVDSKWSEGKKYEYSLYFLNADGDVFSIPGDTTRGVAGTFTVRVPAVPVDTTLLYARDIRFAYFNSGGHYQFGPADTNTSPKADSTSQFARLKWRWDAGQGRHVDSLLVFYKDERSVPDWTHWGSFPGFMDSAYLNFSDKYSTRLAPSQSPRFPLLDSGGKIHFRVIPKHAGKRLDPADTTLDAVIQGMGPSVHALYDKDSLRFERNERDTVDITFVPDPKHPSAPLDWGEAAGRPLPRLYMNDKQVLDTAVLVWEWVDGSSGRLIYQLPSVIGEPTRLRVDLNGVPYRGKPIWMRNPQDQKRLPR